jgi:hypothetical protein
VRSGKADETVSQVLALQQDEDHEDDDDAGCRQRLDQRLDDRDQRCQGAGVGLPDLHRDRLVERLPAQAVFSRLPAGRILQFGIELPEHSGGAFQRARAAGRDPAQALDLVPQGLLIARQFFCEPIGLRDHQAAEAEDDRESDEHRDQHRQCARNPPGLQTDHKGGEHETEQNRQRNRNQDFARKIQRGHDQCGDRQIDQRVAARLLQFDGGCGICQI